MAGEFYTDAEVDELTDGLTQNAAKIRYLRDVCKLRVDRKPNGRPLAWRPVESSTVQNAPSGPNVVGLEQWTKKRKHGTQAHQR